MIDDYEPEKICADLFVEFKDLTYSWSHMDIQCNANQVYSSSTRAVSKDALTSYYNEMQDVYKKDKIKIFDENFGGQSKDNVGLALTCLLILTFMYFIISIQ